MSFFHAAKHGCLVFNRRMASRSMLGYGNSEMEFGVESREIYLRELATESFDVASFRILHIFLLIKRQSMALQWLNGPTTPTLAEPKYL